MSEVKSEVENVSKQEVEDDMDKLDDERLARLKARMQSRTESPKLVLEKTRSIKMGVVGSGQAGSRLAEAFYNLGYDAVVINTALQDLEFIKVPESSKLHLDHGLGGAAKDLEMGYGAADAYREEINELLRTKFSEMEMILFCTSLGGGSGAGSTEVIVELLSNMEMPVAVITVLPQSTDDAQMKHNAIQTLSKFTKYAQKGVIDNLIVVDNARIETIYKDVGQMNFFKVSNEAIVTPIDAFNRLSSKSSPVKGLDPNEFAKLFTDGRGLSVYGQIDVSDYQDEIALAEAVTDNLNSNLLASGFDLKQARYVGVIFAAPEHVWNKIPSSSVNYAMAIVNEACGNPLGVFRGIYVDDIDIDAVRVYSMFSGLGLPESRIDQLKSEAKNRMAQSQEKDGKRNLSLKLEAEDETISEADKVRRMVSQKKSSFGKLNQRVITDRRKK